mmetsp:Transcript_19676/g.37520  ORF Transcript_19676/g.37520 Transcript_19676/m.37520 type:complete len:119 (-) Transcript_19676:255-611(-)
MATLQQMLIKRDRIEEELRMVEKQVYDLETSYLNDSSQYGNVMKGFEGYLAPTKTQNLKRTRNFKTEDRLFSLSSTTSPVADELAQAATDTQAGAKREKSILGAGKGGGLQPGRYPNV